MIKKQSLFLLFYFAVGLMLIAMVFSSCSNNHSERIAEHYIEIVEIVEDVEVHIGQTLMQDLYFQTNNEQGNHIPNELEQWMDEQWRANFVFDLSEVYTIEQIEQINLFKSLIGMTIYEIKSYGFEVDTIVSTLPIGIYFNNSPAKLYLVNDTEDAPRSFGDTHTLSQFFVVSECGIIQTMLPPRRSLFERYTISEVHYKDINGNGINEIIIMTTTFPMWGTAIEWNGFHFYFYENGEFIEHIELSRQVTNVASAMRIYPLPRRDPHFHFDLHFIPSFEDMINYAKMLFLR